MLSPGIILKINCNNTQCDWVLVAHTCNPSYLGDRDQQGYGSRPAEANSS
jgi:hypothetical protein